MPTSLPGGEAPQSMKLYSTSCSSSSFCVAVGAVWDIDLNSFPLAETYSQGSWTPTVLPMPTNAAVPNSGPGGGESYHGGLYSISCPTDGVCAAVGTYEADDLSAGFAINNGLIESLSSDTWTVSEGALPGGPFSGNVNVNSVSCSDPVTCVAVGMGYSTGPPEGVIFSLQSGSWNVQIASVPFGGNGGTALYGVSCPNDTACIAVGSYTNSDLVGVGLIMTLSSGVWTAAPAPFPSNVEPAGPDPQITPRESLSSVSCSEVDVCVTVGFYADSNDNTQPLLMQLESGVWTALQGPVPSDSQSATIASLEGVDCPADGACIATGWYFINELAGDMSGMILTESDGTWTAVPGPLPPDQTNSSMIGADVIHGSAASASDATSSGSSSSLAGVSCAIDGFCAAGGNDNSNGLLETGGITNLPSVTGVAPDTGPAQGGTSVTVTGTNFVPGSVVEFDGVAAPTTFASADQLIATSPPAPAPTPVDVTVTTGGLTSRANFLDTFGYIFSQLTITTAPLPLGTLKRQYSAKLLAGGEVPPYRWSLVSGVLPHGLRLRRSGLIVGKPRAIGTSTFTVQVVDHKTKTQPKQKESWTVSITIE